MSDEKKIIKESVANQERYWVRITRACNNNCIFCLDRENQNASILPIVDIVKDLKKGLDNSAKRVVISGGDPTVHPDLVKIVRKAKRLGYQHVQIITNGRMLAYEKFAIDLKKAGLDEVTLSLHSHIEKDFEEMTGVKGSYKQSLSGLINAQKQGFIVSVDIVINKINYLKLKETLLFYIKMGVSEFDLLHPIPFGSAWDNRDRIFISLNKKTEKYLKDALALSKLKNLFIWTNRMPAQHLEGFEHLIQNPIKMKDEVRGMYEELLLKIREGKKMTCEGDKCKFCFMKDFCRDLNLLINKKTLKAKGTPKCLSVKKGKQSNCQIEFAKDMDPFVFLDFFIKNRYFVKGSVCSKCIYSKTCNGVWIEDVRKNSFNILKAFLK